MRKKEYKEIKNEVQNLLTDFGFVDPDNVDSQLKSIFEVENDDINITQLLTGFKTYEVHYSEFVIELRVEDYEFKIHDIKDFDDKI